VAADRKVFDNVIFGNRACAQNQQSIIWHQKQ
jgi:hypothetical protein